MANPDPQDVDSLLELFNQSDWDEMYLKTDGLEIFLSNDPAATGPTGVAAAPAVQSGVAAAAAGPVGSTPAATATTAAPAPAAAIPDGMIGVTAPNLGTFYRAPGPDASAFAEVGGRVKKGQVVCIVEAMKVMNEIESEIDAEVVDIPVANGQPVEYGEVLFRLRPLN